MRKMRFKFDFNHLQANGKEESAPDTKTPEASEEDRTKETAES